MFKRVLTFVFCLLAPFSWAQEQSSLRQLTTADDAREWAAVGRLDLGGTGFCTGALITDRHVLTAAHCVYLRQSGEVIEPNRIIFRAGLRNGRATAIRRARRFIIHSDYRYDDADKMKRVATDVAIIELERPIKDAAVVPFARFDEVQTGDQVMVVSYAAGREDAPSLQDSCHMLDMRGAVQVFSCEVTFGASGSPVFVNSEAGPRIASVMSAMAQWRDQNVSLAAGLSGPLDGLLNELAATDPVFRSLTAPVGGARESIAAQLGRAPVNASASSLPQISK